MDASAESAQPHVQDAADLRRRDSLTALVDHADASDLDDLDRYAIRQFLADLTERDSAATVSVPYRALPQSF